GGYTTHQFRNHFDAHCGLEVVLPDGEILRTGMGALPGSKTWQQYKTGFGPWIDGLFSQSNFGVVTKIGFWLMPEPDAYLTGTVLVSKHNDLIPLVDTLNYLESSRVCNGMSELFSPAMGMPAAYDAPLPERELAAAIAAAVAGNPKSMEDHAARAGKAYWGCTVK